MMDVKIRIDKKGELPGSIGWLASSADSILLGSTGDGRRGAWLKDKDGKTIELLALDTEDYGVVHLERNAHEYDDTAIRADRNYTDAAWVVLEQLTEIAVEHLAEPAELAKAVTVQVVPKDPVVHAMMQAAKEDPAARSALVDYVANGGN